MMTEQLIDEGLITLNEAAKLLRKSFQTVWRWALRGCRGVELETVRVGGTLCTSRPALARFIEKCGETKRRPAGLNKILESRCDPDRVEAAERKLEAAGI